MEWKALKISHPISDEVFEVVAKNSGEIMMNKRHPLMATSNSREIKGSVALVILTAILKRLTLASHLGDPF